MRGLGIWGNSGWSKKIWWFRKTRLRRKRKWIRPRRRRTRIWRAFDASGRRRNGRASSPISPRHGRRLIRGLPSCAGGRGGVGMRLSALSVSRAAAAKSVSSCGSPENRSPWKFQAAPTPSPPPLSHCTARRLWYPLTTRPRNPTSQPPDSETPWSASCKPTPSAQTSASSAPAAPENHPRSSNSRRSWATPAEEARRCTATRK